MPTAARLGDIGMGVCPGHPIPVPFTSVIIQAGATVSADGNLVANLACVSSCTCGHSAMPILVSSNVLSEGTGIHRLGDTGMTMGNGTYVITQAGITVEVGG